MAPILKAIHIASQLIDTSAFNKNINPGLKGDQRYVARKSGNPSFAARMSPEFLQVRDDYGKFLDMSYDEREVLMTLANMKYGTTNGLHVSPLIMMADSTKDHDEIARILYHVNRKKFEVLKDRYIQTFELELLAEHRHQSGIPRKFAISKGCSKKTASRKKPSPTKKSAKEDIASNNTSLTVNKPAELAGNPYKRDYTPRRKPPQEHRAISAQLPTRLRGSRGKSRQSTVSEAGNIAATGFHTHGQLPTPKMTSVAQNTRIKDYSTIAMPSTGSSLTAPMPVIASSSAIIATQSQPRTRRGPTYPGLISRAIRESANGRLTVAELYEILPTYLSTIVIDITPSSPPQGRKWKTKQEVFQENVRQTLSRYKLLFRNMKHHETGKRTGYWELVVKSEAPPTSSTSSETSHSSNSKRKLNLEASARLSKRAKTAKR